MTAPAPGWYPDPASSGATRWWDGAGWTEHVSSPAPSGSPVVQRSRYGGSPMGNVVGPAVPVVASRPQTWWRRNGLSLAVVGLVALYLLTLLTVHVVFLGILPAVLAGRALRAREPLAVPAAVLAGVAVVLAILQLTAG